MTPRFFRTQAAFRSWLAKNGAKADELLVGFYKLGSANGRRVGAFVSPAKKAKASA